MTAFFFYGGKTGSVLDSMNSAWDLLLHGMLRCLNRGFKPWRVCAHKLWTPYRILPKKSHWINKLCSQKKKKKKHDYMCKFVCGCAYLTPSSSPGPTLLENILKTSMKLQIHLTRCPLGVATGGPTDISNFISLNPLPLLKPCLSFSTLNWTNGLLHRNTFHKNSREWAGP